LTLPRSITEKVKTPDGWISVIISGIIIMIMSVVILKLCQRYPDYTFFQFNKIILGKWIGFILSIIIIIYYITLSAYEVRTMSETIRLFMLQGTPTWAIMMPFLWIGLYLVLGGINPMARLLELIFPITFLFFLLVMFLGIELFEIDNLRPVLGMGIKPVLKGLTTSSLSYAGFEILLYIFMFMKEKQKVLKVPVLGVGVPFIFYTITIVIIVGSFSINGVVSETWPVFSFIRSYEIKGLLFERFDSLLLVIWIMQLFSTFAIAYFIAVLGLNQLFAKSTHPFIYTVLPIIYIIAMIPKNLNDVFTMSNIIGNFALYLFFIMPLILLIVSIVKERVHEKI
jgi:spore germination protein